MFRSSRELAGISFGVLFDILPAEALTQLQREEYGIPSIMPPFQGLFSKERPGRHNNLIWPFLNGFYIQAAANAGLEAIAARELRNMTVLLNSADGIYEIYNPYDGSVDGGWQIGGDDLQGHLWDSCPDQTWSATCYIGALVLGVFGMNVEQGGIRFAPSVPESLKDAVISGVKVRDMELTVEVKGFGSKVRQFLVDGVESDAFLPWDGKDHTITIYMA